MQSVHPSAKDEGDYHYILTMSVVMGDNLSFFNFLTVSSSSTSSALVPTRMTGVLGCK